MITDRAAGKKREKARSEIPVKDGSAMAEKLIQKFKPMEDSLDRRLLYEICGVMIDGDDQFDYLSDSEELSS